MEILVRVAQQDLVVNDIRAGEKDIRAELRQMPGEFLRPGHGQGLVEGHRLGWSLHQMGVLSPVILWALSGSLTGVEYYRTLRQRKVSPRYRGELFERAVSRGHLGLAERPGTYILARGGNRAEGYGGARRDGRRSVRDRVGPSPDN